MAGFVSVGNNIYRGDTFVATGVEVKDGMFVDITEGDTPTAALGSTYFVSCVDDTIDEQAVNTADIAHKAGSRLKIKGLLPYENFNTTEVDGTLTVGSECHAENGVLKAGAGTGQQTFVVLETYTFADKDMYRCIVKA